MIRMILSDFKGLRHIPRIKGASGKKNIDELKDKDGNVISDAKGIVEIFAPFYESLYSRQITTEVEMPAPSSFRNNAQKPPSTWKSLSKH